MYSPGRPTGFRREHFQLFWRAIALGFTTEQSSQKAGLSPAVGARWFRNGGGMPTVSFEPVSGRNLSFSEREEIAILYAQTDPLEK
jgi:hypothetical protein